MARTTAAPAAGPVADTLIFVRLLTALRIFIGISWLSNGLAKVFEKANYDLGIFSGSLIDRESAKEILSGAAHRTGIRPLGGFYEHVVLSHWGIWSILLTVGELAIGLALILGLLASAPAGRYLGYDNQLRARFGSRWPF